MAQQEIWKELVSKTFKKSYNFPVKAANTWFPGHMHKGLRQLQRKIRDVDCVIEVHDARIPFSGRNPTLRESVGGARPSILVLNKKDLFPPEERKRVKKQLQMDDPNLSAIFFTNIKDRKCEDTPKIIPSITKLIRGEGRSQHRTGMFEKSLLVVGIPNVGKSSLINRLRGDHLKVGGRPAAVGATPGWTKAVGERIRVSDRPLVYVLDTPGISVPYIKNMHDGMKLAACNTLKDEVVGIEYICDYILWWLNSKHMFHYVQYMGLEQPEDNSQVMLAKAAIKADKFRQFRDVSKSSAIRKAPDTNLMAKKFLEGFRGGHFGLCNLDDELEQSNISCHAMQS